MQASLGLLLLLSLSATIDGKSVVLEIPSEALNDTDVQPRTCDCGVRGVNRIVNGQKAAQGEIPWQVSLQRRFVASFSPFCGGSIISSSFILTAAHCITNVDTDVKIFSGNVNLLNSGTLSSIEWIKQHEGYSTVTNENDICLIKLQKPLVFTRDVKPVCLPNQSMLSETFEDRQVQISGWGVTRESGQISTDLLKSTQIVVSNEKCKKIYYNKIYPSSLCAYTPNTDTCQGDSGGPLTHSRAGRSYLLGVVSFGRGCARPNIPGVYARVTSYLDWIRKTTTINICTI